eukprot:31321-Prymnesium_polylepis.1
MSWAARSTALRGRGAPSRRPTPRATSALPRTARRRAARRGRKSDAEGVPLRRRRARAGGEGVRSA